jgi:protein tyrosine phosphatase (PTP) superfamily phosphohydrolase (DUF442 family)
VRTVFFFFFAVFAAGCAANIPPQPGYDSFGVPSFAKVTDDVYRSGQPGKHQLAQLIEHYGIKSVVKLNTDEEPSNSPLVEAPAIPWMSVINRWSAPTDEQMKKILDAIDCAPKPVLIHCLHGQDRTGLIIGLWRIRHGATVTDAYTEMMRGGFHSYLPGVWNAWMRATRWNGPETQRALTSALASQAMCPTVFADGGAAAPANTLAAAPVSAAPAPY